MTDHPLMPKPIGEVKDTLILAYEDLLLLHHIIMSHPDGFEVLSVDARLVVLCEHKFVKQEPSGRWNVTEAGMHHVRPPSRKPKHRTPARKH
jgi:hypothetical protein